MPTISVIVPAYNAERTILETIKSVLQQTFSDFELIIINDGSTDQTVELLDTVEDSRLKIFDYENGGTSVARNRGLAHATGEFIAFLDADDLWTSDKLQLQLAALQQHPEAGVAYSWAYYMDEQGKFFHADKPIFFYGNVYAELLVRDFIVSGSNCLIRRQAIESVGEFDPALSCAQDWDYWLRLAARWPFVVVPKLQIYYRISSNSASSNIELTEKCSFIVIERGFQAASMEIQFLKKQSIANNYRHLAHRYFTRVPTTYGIRQARLKLWLAVRLYPQILRDRWTQNLVLKLLMTQVLPLRISNYLIQFVSRVNTTRFSKLRGNNIG